MSRFSLALAGILSTAVATIASGQYQQPYPMYGPGPMSPAAYGPNGAGPMYPPAMYGQPGIPPAAYGYGGNGMPGGMPAAYSYGPMNGGGMYPMPNQAMYSGPGSAGAYGPGPMAPGMYPAAGQNPQAASASNSNQFKSQTQPSAYPNEYHGPQGAVAKANPPPMKLPPGVHTENGLLFYNGSARGDVNYQQYSDKNSGNPNRLVSYQADAEEGAGSNSPGSVMTPGANLGGPGPGGPAPGGMQMGYAGGAPEGNEGYGPGQPCDNQCNDGYKGCCCGCCNWLYNFCHGSMFPGKMGYVWSAGWDNLAMTRNAGTNRNLVFLDNFDGTYTPVFNSNEEKFQWDYGGRLHMELIGPSGITYQATYSKIATYVSQQTEGVIDIGGNLNIAPGDPLLGGLSTVPGFFDVDQVFLKYTSSIQTGELNMIFPVGSFEFVTGYRYMQIDETARIDTISTVTTPAFIDDSSLNRMNGGQVGLLGRWEMFGLIDFDFDAKFAVMADSVTTSQFAIDGATGTPVPPSGVPEVADKTRVAFVTELGLQGVIPLGSSFSFHAGYNVYFIDHVALAPDQFDFINIVAGGQTNVNNHGDLVVQGVNVGMTAVW
ncbi:MAG TPA: BBP7 family outer membrane beta-barrel protein [Pirellulales bacterium]|jgi:hypothetical protein|nr:BBP7 family outer membrane beta-barrel protein [Pirellulales bacterium]